MGGPRPLLGPLRAVLGHSWDLVVSGRSWDLRWRSWAALGAFLGDLGQLLGPMLAILGCLGAFVGGPGPSGAEKWPKSEREGLLGQGAETARRPKPDPLYTFF